MNTQICMRSQWVGIHAALDSDDVWRQMSPVTRANGQSRCLRRESNPRASVSVENWSLCAKSVHYHHDDTVWWWHFLLCKDFTHLYDNRYMDMHTYTNMYASVRTKLSRKVGGFLVSRNPTVSPRHHLFDSRQEVSFRFYSNGHSVRILVE